MNKQHKDILGRIIRGLRQALLGSTGNDGTRSRGNLDRELEQLGILPDGRILPIDALPNATAQQQRTHYAAEVAIARMQQQGRTAIEARNEYLEQAAYSWINRLVALRALEARGLIDETLRPREDYGNLSEALYIVRQENPTVGANLDGGWWLVIERASAQQAKALPGLFSDTDPITTLRPSTPVFLDCLKLIGAGPTGATPDDTDAVFRDPDAIGWAYQFYQEETKQQAFASFGQGKKADTRATIAAATQLFTEPYMVKWLLQNSLGRTYHECYPSSTLPADWEYYIAPTPDRPLNSPAPTTPNLRSLTILDPCVGSGHFLREAFDMLVAMYREQEPELEATHIAENVLRYHLHGIDIDPRAVQLTALTLYLRALDFVRTEAKQRKRPMPTWTPPEMNLATTPTALDEGALDRYLARHPEDRPLRLVLQGIFDNLQQAELLGSLLRPSHDIDAAIADVQRPYQQSLLDESDDTPAFGLNGRDPDALKRLILDRIAATFRHEAATADPADALFGREAERGVRLLQLLDQRYSVVVTNPPYMGSGNMDESLKKFVEKHYKSGKRDLYAAFILRCIELCLEGGRVSMITQQTWMFLRSFSDLRATSQEKLKDVQKKGEFSGLLREIQLEKLAHLGPNAFEEISGEVVQSAMFTLRKRPPSVGSYLIALRLIGLKSAKEKAEVLRTASRDAVREYLFAVKQFEFLSIPLSPVCFWLGSSLLNGFASSRSLGEVYAVQRGVDTCDNKRFLRLFWETPQPANTRWIPYRKAGGYKKWAGLDEWQLDWQGGGEAISQYVVEKFPYLKGKSDWLIKKDTFFLYGWTYSLVAQGSLGVRALDGDAACDSASPAVLSPKPIPGLGVILNSRAINFLLRGVSSDLKIREGYLARTPYYAHDSKLLTSLGSWCVTTKRTIESNSVTSISFAGLTERSAASGLYEMALTGVLHTVEGFGEKHCAEDIIQLSDKEIETMISETGLPAGWFPLVTNYDSVPPLVTGGNLLPIPHGVIDYLVQHERMSPSLTELARIKANLRLLYEAGFGAKDVEQDEGDSSEGEDEESTGGGAYIPIPTETFLEELS